MTDFSLLIKKNYKCMHRQLLYLFTTRDVPSQNVPEEILCSESHDIIEQV